MGIQEATEEYSAALRMGQKQYKELLAAGKEPHPAVLDDIHPENASDTTLDIGVMDIPADLILGTKSAGRITAFTKDFLPLLGANTEFGFKWI